MDAVVSSLGAPAELWENVSPEPRHWLVLRLRGTKSNRDGIGAKIRIARSIRRDDHGTRAMLPPVLAACILGSDAAAQIPKIEIHWPSGVLQTLQDIRADQVLTVTEPN